MILCIRCALKVVGGRALWTAISRSSRRSRFCVDGLSMVPLRPFSTVSIRRFFGVKPRFGRRRCGHCVIAYDPLRNSPPTATWRSGYATVCKTVYPGSIPGVASKPALAQRVKTIAPRRREADRATQRTLRLRSLSFRGSERSRLAPSGADAPSRTQVGRTDCFDILPAFNGPIALLYAPAQALSPVPR